MSAETQGSVTRWIDNLKARDPDAARALWDHYFDRLVRLACAKLRTVPVGYADGEGAALSAFWCLCDGAARGRFPWLRDRDGLWQLLVVLTARKAVDQVRRWRRQTGGGKVPVEDDDALAQIIGREPSPEFVVMVAEQYRHLLDRLDDESLRQVAIWRMEGKTQAEIAERLGWVRQTVARKIELIRLSWTEEET